VDARPTNGADGAAGNEGNGAAPGNECDGALGNRGGAPGICCCGLGGAFRRTETTPDRRAEFRSGGRGGGRVLPRPLEP
jgi:hypothetical protein